MKNLFVLKLLCLVTVIILMSCRLGGYVEEWLEKAVKANAKMPVVKISSPRAIETQTDIVVGDVFNLSGTVSSFGIIIVMEVKMAFLNDKDLVSLGREWRWERGSWQWKEDKGKNWKSYQKSDYESFAEKIDVSIEPSAWEVAGNTVHWNLPVLMHDRYTPHGPGDYSITISATDIVGRCDANSTVKLKVKYDDKKPFVDVQKPVLLKAYPDYPYNEEKGMYEFDTYTYDPVNDPEGTYNDIDNWFTDPLDFQWEIQKNMVGEYSLSFEFTNRHDLNNPNTGELKQLYYRFEWGGGGDTEVDGGVEKRGIFTDGAIPLGYVRVRPALTADEIVMRNLGTYEPDSTLGDLPKIDGKYTPIQVVSKLTDGAGNTTYKSNGWFAYFPEASKAFTSIDFGTKYAYDADPATIKSELKYMGTNTENTGSIAYHKEGVKSLRWELYKFKDGTLDYVDVDSSKAEDGSEFKPFTEHVTYFENATGGNYVRNARWGFYADPAYGKGRFKIVVYVTDLHDKEGDAQIAYFIID